MTPEQINGIAAAMNRAITEACTVLRAEHAQALAEIRGQAEQVQRSLEQRAERAETQAEQVQRDLEALRQTVAEPAVRTMLLDAEGVLHMVQRSGPTLAVRVLDLPERMAEAVAGAMAEAEPRLRADLDSHVARALQRLGDAPKWSRTAVYGSGAVVSCYVGRVYALREGVKASISQEPGEHPDTWERIGSHGLRVMKAKPPELEPGDVFAEGEARFIHDGENTTLFVPRALKQSDLDRVIKPLQAEVRARRNGGGES